MSKRTKTDLEIESVNLDEQDYINKIGELKTEIGRLNEDRLKNEKQISSMRAQLDLRPLTLAQVTQMLIDIMRSLKNDNGF